MKSIFDIGHLERTGGNSPIGSIRNDHSVYLDQRACRFGYGEVGPIDDLGNGGNAIPQLNIALEKTLQRERQEHIALFHAVELPVIEQLTRAREPGGAACPFAMME